MSTEQPDSLYGLYVREVVPHSLFREGPTTLPSSSSSLNSLATTTAKEAAAQTSSQPQWFVLGTGALVYDIYPGPVTADDCYKASPYANFFLALPGVPGRLLGPLLLKLNANAYANATATREPRERRGGALQRPRNGHTSRGTSKGAPPLKTWGGGLPSYVATTPNVTTAGALYEVFCDFAPQHIMSDHLPSPSPSHLRVRACVCVRCRRSST